MIKINLNFSKTLSSVICIIPIKSLSELKMDQKRELSSSSLTRQNAIRKSATNRSKSVESVTSASDLMQFSTSKASSIQKSDVNRPKTRAQRVSAISKWSDQNSSDTEVETDVEIQIQREKKPEKTISEIFVPFQTKQFEEEKKISSLSKWSDNHSEKSRFSKAEISALSIWSENDSTKIQNESTRVSSRLANNRQLSALSKWSDNQSDKEEEIKEENKPEIRKSNFPEEDKRSSLSKWSDNRSEKSRFSKTEISTLSKWSDNQSDKEEEIKKENEPKIQISDWRNKLNTDDIFARFRIMREEQKPVKTSSLSKWPDNESEKGGESRAVSNLSAWTDKMSVGNRLNLSKWTDNDSDGEKTPENKGILQNIS